MKTYKQFLNVFFGRRRIARRSLLRKGWNQETQNQEEIENSLHCASLLSIASFH